MLPLVVSAALLFVSAQAPAQGAVPATYDVSTVKPAAPNNGSMSLNWDDAQLKAENITLDWMLTNVLHARRDQISGIPSWATEKHYDIQAKLTDTDKATLAKLTPDQHRALLLALMVERFGLKYHEDSKVLPTYDLVPWKNGLKLQPAADPGDKTKEANGVCDGCTMWGEHEVKAHDITVSDFAEMLAGQLERGIHDGTGYTAKIDVKLKWAPDLGSKPASDDDASLPPLPQALEQGMGLHLVSTRAPVKLYIIDHLDEPSGN